MTGKHSSLFRNISAGKEQVQLNSGLQLLWWWWHWCSSCCWHWWSLRWYEPDRTIKRQKQKHETNICTRRIRRMWLWSSAHKEARTACVPGHQSRIHISHQGNMLVLYMLKSTPTSVLAVVTIEVAFKAPSTWLWLIVINLSDGSGVRC